MAKALLAGSLLGGVLTLTVWGYQSWGDGAEGAGPELSAETRTAPLESGNGAGRSAANGAGGPRAVSPRAGLRPSPAYEDLPVVQTDELPRAPDEPADEEEGNLLPPEGEVALGTRAAAAASGNGSRRAPAAEGARSASVRSVPARAAAAKPAAAARAAPRRAPPRKSTKPANSADCNPPYFFDSNNIRRLKLECL